MSGHSGSNDWRTREGNNHNLICRFDRALFDQSI